MLVNIVKRFMGTDEKLVLDKWKLAKYVEMGAFTKENVSLISKYTGLASDLIKTTIESKMMETLEEIDPIFAKGLSESYDKNQPLISDTILKTLATIQKQALDFANITSTTMLNNARDEYLKLANNLNYQAKGHHIISTGSLSLLLGVDSIQAATISSIKKLAAEGLTGFFDKNGKQWTPEAYVKMCFRTTMTKTATTTTMTKCEDYGVDIIEVSSHQGARPKCAIDQGRLFDRSGKGGKIEDANGNMLDCSPWSSSSYGEPDGLLGINCGHFISPFFPGISIKRGEETRDLVENQRLYLESQKQRSIEREIRNAKREAIAMKALGQEGAYKVAALKIKDARIKYEGFINSTGRTPRYDRTGVVGYDKKTSADVVKIARAAIKEQKEITEAKKLALIAAREKKAKKLSKELTKNENDSILELETKNDVLTFVKSLPEEEKVAVIKYTSSKGCKEINKPLLAKKTITDSRLIKEIELINNAISKSILPDDWVIYRGTSQENFAKNRVLEGLLPEEWKYKTISNNAFISTSIEKNKAFGGSVQLEINAPKGSRGLYVAPISIFKNEKEMVLSKDDKLYIKDVTIKDDTIYIKADLIRGE